MNQIYCNKPVIGLTIAGLLCLSITFMFDPTHDYPTFRIDISLDPGENTSVTIPTSSTGFMQWSGALISNPYLWVSTDAQDLLLAEFGKMLIPGASLGIPITGVNQTGTTLIRNDGNETAVTNLSFTVAPSPDQLGSSKTWWYIVLAILQTLTGGIIAILKPSTTTGTTTSTAVASTSSTTSSSTQQSCTCPPRSSLLTLIINIFCCWKKKKKTTTPKAATTAATPSQLKVFV